MNQVMAAIECSLKDDDIGAILRHISCTNYDVFIPWCSKIDDAEDVLLPRAKRNFVVTSQQLQRLALSSIWELVLQLWPCGSCPKSIETYEDFIQSHCIGCLIYYDCGTFEFYAKNATLLTQVQDVLTVLGADNLRTLTRNDIHRSIMYP